MITKELFAQGMGQLGGAFGREIDGPVTRTYYAVIGPKLTDEEWQAAVLATVASERFWPSPAVILEKAGRDAETLSQEAFRQVTDALNNHGGYRFLPAEISTAWDAATWAGIKAIGGLREITECTEQRWPGLVRKFCKAYQETLSPRPSITAGEADPKTKRLVSGAARQLSLVGGRDRQIKESE